MLPLVIKISILALVFATGLNADREDLFWIWRRPALLLRSFVAMYLMVPLAALALIQVLTLPAGSQLALLFLSISAGAPLLPKKLIKWGGDPAYAFSLVIACSLLAILTVPLSLALLQPLLPKTAGVETLTIVSTILKTFLIPLGVGLLVREARPAWADRVGEPLIRWAGTALLLAAVLVIGSQWQQLWSIGLPTWIGFAGLTAAALAAGHWLGGPDERDRTSLAVACATRHIGLALLIAASLKESNALTLVATYLFASALISIPYLRWRRRLLEKSG